MRFSPSNEEKNGRVIELVFPVSLQPITNRRSPSRSVKPRLEWIGHHRRTVFPRRAPVSTPPLKLNEALTASELTCQQIWLHTHSGETENSQGSERQEVDRTVESNHVFHLNSFAFADFELRSSQFFHLEISTRKHLFCSSGVVVSTVANASKIVKTFF